MTKVEALSVELLPIVVVTPVQARVAREIEVELEERVGWVAKGSRLYGYHVTDKGVTEYMVTEKGLIDIRYLHEGCNWETI